MSTYDALRGLPLYIDSIAVEALGRAVSDGFTRVTSVVRLAGLGHEGLGEDLIYEVPDQQAFQSEGPRLPLRGEYDIGSFARALGELPLFARPPQDPMAASYRRWALESAALDLALRQANQPLWKLLGLTPRPVGFVVSLGLGDPPSTRRVRELHARQPDLQLKVDARSSWSLALMQSLGACVACVDLKGHYQGQSIYQPPEERLYHDVLEAFPHAWLEDAAVSPGTETMVRDNWHRLSWDAPIHSLDDVRALERPPAAINIKPSRIGSLEALFELYDHCRAENIPMYGGGEFELGPGRRQIQYLAALFHPDAPNDVAPSVFNADPLPGSLPSSPLAIAPAPSGFALLPG